MKIPVACIITPAILPYRKSSTTCMTTNVKLDITTDVREGTLYFSNIGINNLRYTISSETAAPSVIVTRNRKTLPKSLMYSSGNRISE